MAIAAMAGIAASGDVSVTASRSYVDKKTALYAVSNGTQLVGYTLGTYTNVVLMTAGSSTLKDEETARKNADSALGTALTNSVNTITTDLESHTEDKRNPHGVTAGQVGVATTSGVVWVSGTASSALDAGDGSRVYRCSSNVSYNGSDTKTIVKPWIFSSTNEVRKTLPTKVVVSTDFCETALVPDGGRVLTDKLLPITGHKADNAITADYATTADCATTADMMIQNTSLTNIDEIAGNNFVAFLNDDVVVGTYINVCTSAVSRLVADGTDFVTEKRLDEAVTLADATEVTTGEDGAAETNAVDGVKRLAVGEESADLTTKGYVDAAISSAGKVQSVNSQTGAVVVTAAGLGARDLLDLAVYEVATNVTTNEDGTTVTTVSTNATDALVKKSEVGAATNDLAAAIAKKGYITAESDPMFANWERGTRLAAGYGATARGDYSTALGCEADATNRHTIAIGSNATAGGDHSLAIHGADALGSYSCAIGNMARGTNEYSLAIGSGAISYGESSVAIGSRYLSGNVLSSAATASGVRSSAVGSAATASGAQSSAVGSAAKASGAYSSAVGSAATASGVRSSAVGSAAKASGAYSSAVGWNAKASGTYSSAVGWNAKASGTYSTSVRGTASGYYSTAIGRGTANGTNSVAVGSGATANGSYAVAIGDGSPTGPLVYEVFTNVTTTVTEIPLDDGSVSNAVVEVVEIVTNSSATAVGYANADGIHSLALGYMAYAPAEAMGLAYDPAHIYLCSSNTTKNAGSTARSLQSYIRYALVASASASIGAADGNIYALTADTNGVSVTLPTALEGYAQDFVIRLVAADTNGTHFAAISNLTANVDFPMGDVREKFSLKGTNYVTFTQTTKDTWSIGYFAANKEE